MLLCSEILQYITDNMSAEAVMFSPCPTVCSNVFAIVLCQHGLVHRAGSVGKSVTQMLLRRHHMTASDF